MAHVPPRLQPLRVECDPPLLLGVFDGVIFSHFFLDQDDAETEAADVWDDGFDDDGIYD